jgi:hypothetical protein
MATILITGSDDESIVSCMMRYLNRGLFRVTKKEAGVYVWWYRRKKNDDGDWVVDHGNVNVNMAINELSGLLWSRWNKMNQDLIRMSYDTTNPATKELYEHVCMLTIVEKRLRCETNRQAYLARLGEILSK